MGTVAQIYIKQAHSSGTQLISLVKVLQEAHNPSAFKKYPEMYILNCYFAKEGKLFLLKYEMYLQNEISFYY